MGELDKVVEAFLLDIGMERYAPLFAKEHIDAIVLRGLVDEDLKSIGVNALGDRKKILGEIHRMFSLPPPKYDDDDDEFPPSYSEKDASGGQKGKGDPATKTDSGARK